VARIRYAGETVPLSEVYAEASVMIVAPDSSGDMHPIGTGFLVAMPGPAPGTAHEYVITAAHVVRFAQQTHVRLSRVAGGTEDLPVDRWVFHDDGETDVAVVPVRLSQSEYQFKMVPIEAFLDEHPIRPLLAEDVFFVGVLEHVKSMHDQNVPMARSGTLGRLYQDGVEVRWPDGTHHRLTAHLIDCRSHRGFSGSPCYLQVNPRAYPDLQDRQDTFLLGLITGHLDEIGVQKTNAGVGLVTPVEDIRHVLMQPELAEPRNREFAAHEARYPAGSEAAIMDLGRPPVS